MITEPQPMVVCGWFTPDYRPWWHRLRKILDADGVPHDFVERRKSDGGWEANTRRKPGEILDAMRRHPDTTVVFLDVDCVVRGGLAALQPLAYIAGDVGLYTRTKWRRSGKPWGGPRSGTIVLRPTDKAHALVNAWIAETCRSPAYAVDQDSLAVALGRVPGLSVTHLDVRFCTVPADDCPEPIILHDSASRGTKTPRLRRMLARLKTGRIAA